MMQGELLAFHVLALTGRCLPGSPLGLDSQK